MVAKCKNTFMPMTFQNMRKLLILADSLMIWAYDAVDKECYLFYGCTGEQYDDDYTLFTQNYGERLDLEKLGARNTWPVSPAESSKVVGAFTFLAAAALLAV